MKLYCPSYILHCVVVCLCGLFLGGEQMVCATGIDAPTSPEILSVYSDALTIQWELTAGATGYKIAVSTWPPNLYTEKTIAGNGSTTATISHLRANTEYYIYVFANGFTMSSGSAIVGPVMTLPNSAENKVDPTIDWPSFPAASE